MIPVNAKIMQTISNGSSISFNQHLPRMAVLKIFELNTTNQTLNGKILFAVANPMNPITCVQLLNTTAGFKPSGIEEYRVSLNTHATRDPAISMFIKECMSRTSKGETE